MRMGHPAYKRAVLWGCRLGALTRRGGDRAKLRNAVMTVLAMVGRFQLNQAGQRLEPAHLRQEAARQLSQAILATREIAIGDTRRK